MPVKLIKQRMPDTLANKVAKASLEIIADVLDEAGADGDFLVAATKRFHSKVFPKFKFVRYESAVLFCKVRPGGNDTAWEWLITAPSAAEGSRISDVLSGKPAANEEPFNPFPTLEPGEAEPAEPEPAVVTPSETFHAPTVGTIEERFEMARKAAEPYEKKVAELAVSQEQLRQAYQRVEELDKQIATQEKALAADSDGKKAYEALAQINQLLGMGD